MQEMKKVRGEARKAPRHGHRNDTLILTMFRHALSVSEAITLRWEQVDFSQGLLHIKRVKNGIPSIHPLQSDIIRALKRLKKRYLSTLHLFCTERQGPLSPRTVHYTIASAGKAAKLPFTIHPHMLRHSAGFYLASKGIDTRAIQAYMGHASIQNTVRYTALNAGRFSGFWKE